MPRRGRARPGRPGTISDKLISNSDSNKPAAPTTSRTMDAKAMPTTRAVETTLKARFLSNPTEYVSTVEKLRRNGSNIDEWIKGINTVGLMVFGISKFTHDIENLRSLTDNESIILCVFFTLTIKRELRTLMAKEVTAAGAFETIKKNFQLSN